MAIFNPRDAYRLTYPTEATALGKKGRQELCERLLALLRLRKAERQLVEAVNELIASGTVGRPLAWSLDLFPILPRNDAKGKYVYSRDDWLKWREGDKNTFTEPHEYECKVYDIKIAEEGC